MQFTNELKAILFSSRKELESHRLSLEPGELRQFWKKHTLSEIEALFTLAQPHILQYLQYFLRESLQSKRLSQQVFMAAQGNSTLLYLYDCKLFRSQTFCREDNDCISAFIMYFREGESLPGPMHQFISEAIVPTGHWALKVKTSALLRIYSQIQTMRMNSSHPNDVIVLPQELYGHFLAHWTKCHSSYQIENNLLSFFKGVLHLLENQLLLSYFQSLSEEELHERRYLRPIRILQKPRNVEQFTLVELRFGQIRWQSLKVSAFKLKYRVVQKDSDFLCYRIQSEEQDQPPYDLQVLNEQDRNILYCFDRLRSIEQEYKNNF